jgi:hypothetical protein
VLPANPIADLEATKQIVMRVKDGRPVVDGN